MFPPGQGGPSVYAAGQPTDPSLPQQPRAHSRTTCIPTPHAERDGATSSCSLAADGPGACIDLNVGPSRPPTSHPALPTCARHDAAAHLHASLGRPGAGQGTHSQCPGREWQRIQAFQGSLLGRQQQQEGPVSLGGPAADGPEARSRGSSLCRRQRVHLTGMMRQQQTSAMTIGSHCRTSQLQLVGAQLRSAR